MFWDLIFVHGQPVGKYMSPIDYFENHRHKVSGSRRAFEVVRPRAEVRLLARDKLLRTSLD
ncbi:hypothetical protein PanWU01x14_092020 [Parasponia andersonii]|uniref:Uncharacterized protein n=1 Tax=Parasponia andersonii TaxID=3476 RepID=A0A2P5D6G3_PARAD|nr:hypothetical protein PanWU01x14_092020 [Parasponia andersonii]